MREASIPRVFHFIWVGKPLPGHLAVNIDAWSDMHPDWQVRLWTEKELSRFGLLNRNLYKDAEAIAPADAVGQFRSDIARYEILARYGGFYADVDTYPLRPIDSALVGVSAFAAAEDQRWVGNTYLGAVPRHPVFRELVAKLPQNVETGRKQRWRPNKLSGPQFLTPIWRKYDCTVGTSAHWYPFSYTHVKNGAIPPVNDPEVYAVHSWNHTRELMESRKR